jgi:hypothetical protein
MPTNFRTAGAIHQLFRPYGQVGWSYLGTSVTDPVMKEGDRYLPIFNSLGGRSVPMQLVGDRRMCMIVTTLNRFNWTNYNTLRQLTGPIDGATYFEREVDHGTLTLGTSSSFDFLVLYTFGNATGFPSDSPNGRLYNGCVLKDWDEDPRASRTMDVTLTIESYGIYDPLTRVFSRYSEDPSHWAGASSVIE